MNYPQIIESSLVYIEETLNEKLTIESLAKHFHLSKYYFHRLFSAVMGISFQQYLTERKLNRSLQLIQETELSLTDISYQLQFANPASFSRSFKKHYGFPPSQVRKSKQSLDVLPIPLVVERPFKNFNGDIITQFSLEYLPKLKLQGIAFQIDLAQADYKEQIRSYVQKVREDLPNQEELKAYMVYSNCHEGSTKFNALYGFSTQFESDLDNIFQVEVPDIFCAKFNYKGDLLEMSDIFVDDFAKAMKLKQLKSQDHQIELIQEFAPNDGDMSNYHIWVPIEQLDEEKNF